MDTYTVTFKYDGVFDLPDPPEEREKKVPEMVLEKMQKHEFELVDFNLARHYDEAHACHYINDPHLPRAVLEISITLSRANLKSREAIYNRCLEALQHNEVCLDRAYENENEKLGVWQSIINFKMKNECQDKVKTGIPAQTSVKEG